MKVYKGTESKRLNCN